MSKDAIHLRLGPLVKRVRLLCVLAGHSSVSEYVRSCVERCVSDDLNKYPNALLYMRPDQPVYSVKEHDGVRTYTAITRTLGGERCWVLSFLGNLPMMAGGEAGVLCDLTVEPGKQGCEGRSVVVAIDSVIGPGVLPRAIRPPGVTDA